MLALKCLQILWRCSLKKLKANFPCTWKQAPLGTLLLTNKIEKCCYATFESGSWKGWLLPGSYSLGLLALVEAKGQVSHEDTQQPGQGFSRGGHGLPPPASTNWSATGVSHLGRGSSSPSQAIRRPQPHTTSWWLPYERPWSRTAQLGHNSIMKDYKCFRPQSFRTVCDTARDN